MFNLYFFWCFFLDKLIDDCIFFLKRIQIVWFKVRLPVSRKIHLPKENKKKVTKIYMYLFALFFSLVAFFFYLEINPKLGNIWFRNGRFSPKGYVKCLVYPLQEKQIWQIKNWDLNIFYIFFLVYITLLCAKYLYYSKINWVALLFSKQPGNYCTKTMYNTQKYFKKRSLFTKAFINKKSHWSLCHKL